MSMRYMIKLFMRVMFVKPSITLHMFYSLQYKYVNICVRSSSLANYTFFRPLLIFLKILFQTFLQREVSFSLNSPSSFLFLKNILLVFLVVVVVVMMMMKIMMVMKMMKKMTHLISLTRVWNTSSTCLRCAALVS